MAKSAAMAAGVSHVSGNSNPAGVCTPRNNLGLMARCRLGAGSALAKALKRARVAGSSWDKPERCKGLGWRLFLSAATRWPEASCRVPAAIGLLRFPSIDPVPLSHCAVQRQVIKDLTRSASPGRAANASLLLAPRMAARVGNAAGVFLLRVADLPRSMGGAISDGSARTLKGGS